MSLRVNVIGVGNTGFTLAGAAPHAIRELQAVGQALRSASLPPRALQSIFVASAAGRRGGGQDDGRWIGASGTPVRHVPDDCGATALWRACRAIELGEADCVLALGVETSVEGWSAAGDSLLAGLGKAAREYLRRHGYRREMLAMIAVKSRDHAAANPHALFAAPLSLEEVLASDMVFDPLTRLQCAVRASGAGAVVLCSDAFARRHGIGTPVYVCGQATTSRPLESADSCDVRDAHGAVDACGFALNVEAARRAYELAGIGPQELGVCELHDASTISEALLYEALGFCRPGQAQAFVEDGDNSHGGAIVVNPSGGLLARGHAPAVTALAQCAELVLQLQGRAGERQVERARMALQHSQSMAGASLVTLYRRD